MSSIHLFLLLSFHSSTSEQTNQLKHKFISCTKKSFYFKLSSELVHKYVSAVLRPFWSSLSVSSTFSEHQNSSQPADGRSNEQRRPPSYPDINYWELRTSFNAAIVSDFPGRDKSEYWQGEQQALAGATSWTLNQLQHFLRQHGSSTAFWQRANYRVVYQGELFFDCLK